MPEVHSKSTLLMLFFSFTEFSGKEEIKVINEYMHEYTVYVLGVSDFASLLLNGHWR